MYKALASAYDHFMFKSDYDSWLKLVNKYIKGLKFGADLGCGTGNFTILLSQLGYMVYGVDSSIDMLQIAKEHAIEAGVKIDFICADMQKVELKKVQFITAICDCVNYLAEPTKFFNNVYNSLQEDGVFVFDISSEFKLRNILGNSTYSDTRDDITYIWQNYLNEKKKCVEFELTLFKPCGDSYKKTHERQVQYIHKVSDLTDKLKSVGFSSVRSLGLKGKILDKEERIFFVAKR